MKELIVDNFAGGGGASTGIEQAIGRAVDLAINHDKMAIEMHKVNHPHTKHYIEDVWNVDPLEATKGQPVGLAWFSPDCKHFSKAKGGKPVDKNIRGLAWVAVKWAKLVKPRIIILENVEEFKTWGPLRIVRDGKTGRPIVKTTLNHTRPKYKEWTRIAEPGEIVSDEYLLKEPDPDKKGQTFYTFVQALKRFGYEVQFRELRACDYGTPTTRKRFFMIARCDGEKIAWPEPTHGDPEGIEVRMGLLKPWRASAECIDWSIPIQSVFTRKKPLAENTLTRIAKGIQKFVIEADNPFILEGENKIIFLQHYYGQQGKETRGSSLNEPLATIPTANRFGLVTAFISRQFKTGAGHELDKPLATSTTVNKSALVTAFLIKYYSGEGIGQSLNDPLHTITTKDRFGLVTIKGENYQITDIAMRMLKPHELFKAQGFPDDYIIDVDSKGNPYPITQQTAKVGNSVCPPLARAIVEANYKEEIRENVG